MITLWQQRGKRHTLPSILRRDHNLVIDIVYDHQPPSMRIVAQPFPDEREDVYCGTWLR